MRLPTSLQNLVDGLKGGSGPRSLLSHSMTVGVKPDRVPIVVYRSRGNGSNDYRETLATICALREDASGERILMLSWDLQPSGSPLDGDAPNGPTAETLYDVLIPIERLAGTLRSMSPSLPTIGISGVPCDGCGEPMTPGTPYRTDVAPGPKESGAGGRLRLLCLRCAEQSRTFMG